MRGAAGPCLARGAGYVRGGFYDMPPSPAAPLAVPAAASLLYYSSASVRVHARGGARSEIQMV